MLLKTQKKNSKIDKILMLVKCLLMLLSSPDTPPPPGGVWVEKCILYFNFFYQHRTYAWASKGPGYPIPKVCDMEDHKYCMINNQPLN